MLAALDIEEKMNKLEWATAGLVKPFPSLAGMELQLPVVGIPLVRTPNSSALFADRIYLPLAWAHHLLSRSWPR